MAVVTLTTCVLLLAIGVATNGQRITIMMPTTSTSTLTCTTTASTNCFSLNSAAGPITPCRKRRQFWVEEPIILMAPPESLFIQPSDTFRVEPTAVPMDWLKSDQVYYSGFNGGAYLHPSIVAPANDYRYANFLANQLHRNGPVERQSAPTTKRTVMYTRTKTVTENEMTTKTNTIGISGCTVSPLPFDLCV